jgi:hypothetical protein
MNYLSPQIKALAEKRIKKDAPLVRKGFSCGIFQEYEAKIKTEPTSEGINKT